MASVCLSCMARRGILSVVLMSDGKLISRNVERLDADKSDDSAYLDLIQVFKKGLMTLKLFMEENPELELVTLECSNSILVKWVSQGYARDAYQKEFAEMMELLNDIPMQYSFSFTKKPRAFQFADEKYIAKEKLSGIDDLF